MYEKTFAKYEKDFPKSVKYVRDNMTDSLRCYSCNCPILKQPDNDKYPFQCLNCDEDRTRLEVHTGSPADHLEMLGLIMDTVSLLCLDE